MAALNPRPQTPVPAPASYAPTPADLDQMHRIKAIHDVLDLCPALPLDVRLGLLDHAWLLLGGDGQPAAEPRRVA